MKKKAHFLSILFISFLVLVCSGCSQILNMALIPFAPDFVPNVNFTSNGAEINYSMSTEKKYTSKDNDSYTQDFGYYIWRSTVSPYQDYELIGRVYFTSLAHKYTNWSSYKGKPSESEVDFSVPDTSDEDKKRNIKDKTSGTFIDPMPLSTTCYYRVSKVKLRYSHTKSDDSESKTYSLTSDTSGWVSSSPKSN